VVEGSNFDMYLVLTIKNKSGQEVSGINMQFKPNYFGFKVGKPNSTSIAVDGSLSMKLLVETGVSPNTKEALSSPWNIVVALKCNLDLWYFKVEMSLHYIYTQVEQVSNPNWTNLWSDLARDCEPQSLTLKSVNPGLKTLDNVVALLGANNVFVVQKNTTPNQYSITCCAKTRSTNNCLWKINFNQGLTDSEITCVSENKTVATLGAASLKLILSSD